ncbi:MAG TPA: agmatinase [Gemmatimonadaceae bacterium]|jgi:agmatinase
MVSATLLGIPYDAASSFKRGPALAPARIREELWSDAGNTWTERLVDLSAPGVLADAGDVSLGDSTDGVAVRRAIEEHVERIVVSGSRPISLGGDHSVTYPLLCAMHRRHPTITILHVDAHADLYDVFEGDRFSHACPFARIMEAGLATRLVQVGIRTLTRHQRDQADRFGVEIIDMDAWAAGERPLIERDETVYLSLDLDGLDPAFAPGVSHPEPGGLSVRDVLGLIHALPADLVGADVVECNPAVDPTGVTAVVAAKFVKEIAAQMHAFRPRSTS